MLSGQKLRRILAGMAGILGFSSLMAARETFPDTYLRALVAALAALVLGSAFLYIQRTKPAPRR